MRKILIDTHVFLWYTFIPEKLLNSHIELISDENSQIFVSTASLFEINIKRGISKLSFEESLEELMEMYGFERLSITYPHLEMLRKTSFIHKDPFDKMIIAQALSEDLEVISYDEQFRSYTMMLI